MTGSKETRQGRIVQFTGDFSFLSNFHVSPVQVHGLVFKSAEHAYQAAKTENPEWRKRIMDADTPGKAKKLGRECPLRPGWEELKLAAMHHVVQCKFGAWRERELLQPYSAGNPSLAARLMATGTAELVEGNNHGDMFWGRDLATGKGKNWLGKLLMLHRSWLYSARLAVLAAIDVEGGKQ